MSKTALPYSMQDQLEQRLQEMIASISPLSVNPDSLHDLLRQCFFSGAQAQHELAPPQATTVLLNVSGGLVEDVFADGLARVIVLDSDIEGGSEENIGTIDGENTYIIDHTIGVGGAYLDTDRIKSAVTQVDAHWAAQENPQIEQPKG